MFHGYGSSRSDIIPESTVFYKMQYNVLMLDFRAHGNSEGNICSMGYYEAGDVKAAYNFISSTGEKNIILWGGSMDAASITKAMHDDHAIKPSKIILEKCFRQDDRRS
jgi:pimeloyl-ACP methyl ester carboxylesterase